MSDSWYYDFMNLNHAVSRALIDGKLPYEIHYIKDIMSTKVGMFKYKNIERIPNLTSQILEMALLFSNFLCFYQHPALGSGPRIARLAHLEIPRESQGKESLSRS